MRVIAVGFVLWITGSLMALSQNPPPRDPLDEMQRRIEKESVEKNYKDLKDAATELMELSKQLSADVDKGGQHVISARIFERLDRIEKLAKRIRDKAKGNAIILRQP